MIHKMTDESNSHREKLIKFIYDINLNITTEIASLVSNLSHKTVIIPIFALIFAYDFYYL